MENNKIHIIKKVWVNLCRFLLAGVFIFSGFVKAVDPLGFQYKIQDYLIAFKIDSWFPDFLPLLLAIVFSAIEFIIGIFLFFGIRRGFASFMALLFMIVMTPLTLYLAIYNPVPDCGCFGEALVLTNWETFGKNIVLLAAAWFVYKWRKLILRFVSFQMEWLVSLYTLFFVFILSIYCLRHLPILDFRPYKIGVDMAEAMGISGTGSDGYVNEYLYEKDGVQKSFTLEALPDSTWTFVARKSISKPKDAESAVQDFYVQDMETGEELTQTILADSSYTFLLVAHRLEEAYDGNIDLINEVYDYAVENGYHFYCLTSSASEQVEQWKDRTGAEYPFLNADDITLKTVIRSNPGLLLLKDGTILNKWSDSDIPDEYALTGRLEDLPVGQQKDTSRQEIMSYVMAWFLFPLLGVVAIDLAVVRQLEKRRQRHRIKR